MRKTSPAKKGAADGRKRIMLVDDHAIVREGLRAVIDLEADLMVCGEAEDAAQALEVIKTADPHLVIVDLVLRSTDGLDLIKDINLRHPKVMVLVVSMHDETQFAARALHNGAHGYLSKRDAMQRLVRAIRRVMAGEVYLSEQMAIQIAAKIVGHPRGDNGLPVDKFSDRELQVFKMIGSGRSTREIAAALHLDISTVDSYRARLKVKLGITNANELLHTAIEWTHGSASR